MKGGRKQKLNTAFTLIELLMVISIISLLASIMLVSFVSARASARASVAKQDLKTMEQSLLLYNADNGQYPSTQWNTNPSGSNFVDTCYDATSCSQTFSLSQLLSGGYVNSMPYPPVGLSQYDGLWYMSKITTNFNGAVGVLINCDYIGSTCGFKAPYDRTSCVNAYGLMPNGTIANAMLMFTLENGVSTDYPQSSFTGSPLGGNAICLY